MESAREGVRLKKRRGQELRARARQWHGGGERRRGQQTVRGKRAKNGTGEKTASKAGTKASQGGVPEATDETPPRRHVPGTANTSSRMETATRPPDLAIRKWSVTRVLEK